MFREPCRSVCSRNTARTTTLLRLIVVIVPKGKRISPFRKILINPPEDLLPTPIQCEQNIINGHAVVSVEEVELRRIEYRMRLLPGWLINTASKGHHLEPTQIEGYVSFDTEAILFPLVDPPHGKPGPTLGVQQESDVRSPLTLVQAPVFGEQHLDPLYLSPSLPELHNLEPQLT